jgi:hypothetical protein
MLKVANNASAFIVDALEPGETIITITGGYGDLFPALNPGDYFIATLSSSILNEIVHVTERVGDVFTVVQRAQEGTLAQVWPAGTRIQNLMTAGSFMALVQS